MAALHPAGISPRPPLRRKAPGQSMLPRPPLRLEYIGHTQTEIPAQPISQDLKGARAGQGPLRERRFFRVAESALLLALWGWAGVGAYGYGHSCGGPV